VYVLTDQAAYLEQFGVREIDADSLPEPLARRLEYKRGQVSEDVVPLAVAPAGFSMPTRLREAFKTATGEERDPEPAAAAEDFGIDPDEATYKYDTGR